MIVYAGYHYWDWGTAKTDCYVAPRDDLDLQTAVKTLIQDDHDLKRGEIKYLKNPMPRERGLVPLSEHGFPLALKRYGINHKLFTWCCAYGCRWYIVCVVVSEDTTDDDAWLGLQDAYWSFILSKEHPFSIPESTIREDACSVLVSQTDAQPMIEVRCLAIIDVCSRGYNIELCEPHDDEGFLPCIFDQYLQSTPGRNVSIR